MNSPYALFRMFWRPMTLALLYMPLLASSWPVITLGEQTGDPFAAFWKGEPAGLVRSALWHLIVLLPAATGFVTALARADLQHSTLGWCLPGLRRGLLVGELLVALPVALGLGALLSRGGPASEAWAGVGLALFWFVLPGTVIRSGVPRTMKLGLGAVLVVSAALPSRLQAVAEAEPLLLAIVTVGVAVLMLRHQASAASARQQPLAGEASQRLLAGEVWPWRTGGEEDWARPLNTDRMLPWLYAAGYEAGRGQSWRYLRRLAFGALFAVGWAHLSGNPGMAMLGIALFVGPQSLQLSHGLPYPLSRERRARMAVAGNLVDAVLACLLMAGLVPLVRRLPIPESWFFDQPRSGLSWPLTIAIIFAWLPLAQWSGTRAAAAGRGPVIVFGTHFGGLFAVMLMTLFSSKILTSWWREGERGGVVTALVLLVVLVQTVHWWAVHRYFARRDLVTAS